MGNVSHGSWKGLAPNFQKDEGRRTKGNYMKLAEKKEWGAIFFLLGIGEAKFRFCSLGSVAFVWIWIVLS
jgi:hypothetical protein